MPYTIAIFSLEMHTKGTFLIFIVLVGLFAIAPAKRIYVTLQADADATSAGQRIRNFAATVGSIRHEFPHFNSASMEVKIKKVFKSSFSVQNLLMFFNIVNHLTGPR